MISRTDKPRKAIRVKEWKFWRTAPLPPHDHETSLTDSPLVVLAKDVSGRHLHEEILRAGLAALSRPMVSRARLLSVTAHSSSGRDDLADHLARVAGFLAIAKADEELIAGGWCSRVLQETAVPPTLVSHEVSRDTKALVANGITHHHIGAIVSAPEQALAMSIVAPKLLESLLKRHVDTEVRKCMEKLERTIIPLGTPVRHLLALNCEMARAMAGFASASMTLRNS